MKYLCTVALSLCVVVPLSANAAWYWLSNPEIPELGDFVSLSALEYEEFKSKGLLIYIEDDLMALINQAENYERCGSDYEKLTDSLKKNESKSFDYWENKLIACMEAEIKKAEAYLAFKECDFDYINEKLSSSEKFTYRNEIANCKENEQLQTKSEVKDAVVPVEKIQQQIQSQIQQAVPVVAPNIPIPAEASPVTILEEEESEEVETPVEANSEKPQDNNFVNSEVQEVVPITTQNVFQRIIDFFSRLFSW